MRCGEVKEMKEGMAGLKEGRNKGKEGLKEGKKKKSKVTDAFFFPYIVEGHKRT